jgi:hypothetical protein
MRSVLPLASLLLSVLFPFSLVIAEPGAVQWCDDREAPGFVDRDGDPALHRTSTNTLQHHLRLGCLPFVEQACAIQTLTVSDNFYRRPPPPLVRDGAASRKRHRVTVTES